MSDDAKWLRAGTRVLFGDPGFLGTVVEGDRIPAAHRTPPDDRTLVYVLYDEPRGGNLVYYDDSGRECVPGPVCGAWTSPGSLRLAGENGVPAPAVSRSGVGWVVVEWNQASGQPQVLDGSLTNDRDWAGEVCADERRRTAEAGRRERYAVAEVVPVEDPA